MNDIENGKVVEQPVPVPLPWTVSELLGFKVMVAAVNVKDTDAHPVMLTGGHW